MQKKWWKEAVVYQIYPRSFKDSNGDGVGDINGIISKLDYLKELGIDVIWLSPVYESPNDDNGYDISHYQKIMNEFGTMEDWEHMLEEIHRLGMKLIMDLVVNHTSDEHPWFIESRKDKNSPYRDYYIWKEGKAGREPTNWEATFGGSAWQYDEATGEYYLHLFSKKQPDLNWENPALRDEVYQMMIWWLDKGIDGFRMDVINFISKDQRFLDGEPVPGKKYVSGHPYFMNGPKIHEHLQEMHEQVLSKNDILTVGEMPGATPEEGILYTGEDRKELQMVFHFEHMDIDSGNGKWDIQPWSLVELKSILAKWQYALENDGWNSLYWNNHDQPRIVSRFGNDKEYRDKSAKMLATCLHFMKGTPYIYQGEEFGMTNVQFDSIEDYRDIETLNMYKEKIAAGKQVEDIMQSIYVKSRDNARTPVQWDDSENAGFTTGKPWIKVNPNYKNINAKDAMENPDSIFHYYRKLIQLRKQEETIVYGKFDLLAADDANIFAYTRTLNNDQLFIINNFSNKQLSFILPSHVKGKTVNTLISNTDEQVQQLGKTITLEAYDSYVFRIH